MFSNLKQQSEVGPEQTSDRECVFMWCYTEGAQGLSNSTKTFTMQSTHKATGLKTQTRFLHYITLLFKQLSGDVWPLLS